jgi:hypothetical protein
MDTTKNELSPYASIFFHKLSSYIDTKLYYYGSVQRIDYFPNSSDIDIDIFTNNETSTIHKMQSFLKTERSEFKKFIYHLGDKIIYGNKLKYSRPEHNLFVEFSIYNEKDQAEILEEHSHKMHLPFYITFLLIILKFLYYEMGIMPKTTYKNIKNSLIDTYTYKHKHFVILD